MSRVTSLHAPVAVAVPDAAVRRTAARLPSIDIVRGAVMVLMALDHSRVFLSNAPFDPTNLSRTTLAYFMTRWVTHFCAPAFVFLAGSGAFFRGRREGSRAALSQFLLTRGAWLILMEMTVIRLGWTFNFDYAHYVLGGVIWMIGWCMVLMAGLVWLPAPAVAALGLAIIFGHNVMDLFSARLVPSIRQSSTAWLWQILYFGGPVKIGATTRLAVLFSVVPWVGVMAAGYGFGRVLEQPPARRNRICMAIGLGAIALFAVLRGFNLYGNPRPWVAQPSLTFTFLSILNTAKYPASLSFLLMTLGPIIALLPALEKVRGPIVSALAVFGKTPFFYYILHIPLIHAVACVLSLVRYGTVVPWLFLNHPLAVSTAPPEGWGYNLAIVYLVTAVVVALLYLPCRWFAGVKSRRRDAWLSYL